MGIKHRILQLTSERGYTRLEKANVEDEEGLPALLTNSFRQAWIIDPIVRFENNDGNQFDKRDE